MESPLNLRFKAKYKRIEEIINASYMFLITTLFGQLLKIMFLKLGLISKEKYDRMDSEIVGLKWILILIFLLIIFYSLRR